MWYENDMPDVMFLCDDPHDFQVSINELGMQSATVDIAIAKLIAHIYEQLSPTAWSRNEFADCYTVVEKTQLFRKWLTVIHLLETKNYETYQVFDDDGYLDYTVVSLPLFKTMSENPIE